MRGSIKMPSQNMTTQIHQVCRGLTTSFLFQLRAILRALQVSALVKNFHARSHGANNDQHHQNKDTDRLDPLTLFSWHTMQHRLEVNKNSAAHRSGSSQHTAERTNCPQHVKGRRFFNSCAGEHKRHSESHALCQFNKSLHGVFKSLGLEIVYPPQTPSLPSFLKITGRPVAISTHKQPRLPSMANSNASLEPDICLKTQIKRVIALYVGAAEGMAVRVSRTQAGGTLNSAFCGTQTRSERAESGPVLPNHFLGTCLRSDAAIESCVDWHGIKGTSNPNRICDRGRVIPQLMKLRQNCGQIRGDLYRIPQRVIVEQKEQLRITRSHGPHDTAAPTWKNATQLKRDPSRARTLREVSPGGLVYRHEQRNRNCSQRPDCRPGIPVHDAVLAQPPALADAIQHAHRLIPLIRKASLP